MKELECKIIDPIGLYAKPAAIVVNTANKFTSVINLTYNNRTVNMKSIMGVMSSGIPTNATITITCDGIDEDVASKIIVKTLSKEKIIKIIEPKTKPEI